MVASWACEVTVILKQNRHLKASGPFVEISCVF